MRNEKKWKSDPFQAYREAGDVLAEGGNRLLLIEAILVGLVSVMLYIMLYTAFQTVFGMLDVSDSAWTVAWILYGVLVFALTLYFTLPLLWGLLRLSCRMEKGESPTLSELFYCFSDAKRYLNAVVLSWHAIWRVGLIVLTVAVTCNVAVYFFAGSVLAGILCGVAVVLEIAVGFCLCMRRFALVAILFTDDLPMQDAVMISDRMHEIMPCAGIRFFLAFLPRILLGILTLGVYLLWDALPRMCVAYFRYCKQMNEMIIRSEEYKNHE